MLEIEWKAKITDEAGTEKKLLELGFREEKRLVETDIYYQGVNRNFRETDEALRLRVTDSVQGESTAALTYKGPNQSETVKTREEIEVGVLQVKDMACILERLGHKSVRQVKKTRAYYTRGDVTACVDMVEGLGAYLELEVLRHEGEREQAAAELLRLLNRLGFDQSDCTRKSYLEMLLEKDAGPVNGFPAPLSSAQ